MLPNNRPYLIAETAFHHEGDVSFLIDLISLSKTSEADAIKFHLLFDLDDYITKDHPGHNVLKNLLISEADWASVISKAQESKLDVITLVNDKASIQWVNENHQKEIKAVEIHATGLNDIFLLEECSKFQGTVILGIGGSTFDEISFAIDFLKKKGKSDIFLMHGFQNYPTRFEDINLKRMEFMKNAFALPVGFADHTDPAFPNNIFISCIGVACGFNVVEKHITKNPAEKRIDHQAAVDAGTFREIKVLMRQILDSVGDHVFQMSEAELKYGDTGPMKKALVARKKIKKGEKILPEHIAFKRTKSSSYLKQNSFSLIIGSEALKDIDEDEILSFSNLSYEFKVQDFSQFQVK